MEKNNFTFNDSEKISEEYRENYYNNFDGVSNTNKVPFGFNDQIYSDQPKISSKDKTTSNMNNNILSEKRTQLQVKSDKINETNLEEEKDFCGVCCEDLFPGEIINYCLCSKFYHPNCLIYVYNKFGTGSNKNCEDCLHPYQFANYKQPNQTDSTWEKTMRTDNNTSLMDTNLNKLDNYDEMCGMAFHMSHEGISEIINRKNENLNQMNSSEKEMERIALSPIILSTTPYSGKMKGQISSNQKVEDYIRMQNTHTTPNNPRHLNMSENQSDDNMTYEQSPEEGLQRIRQHLTFYSPNVNMNATVNNQNFNQSNKSQSALISKENVNFDIDKFFKSINFDLSSVGGTTTDMTSNLLSSNNNQISFRKIVFEDNELDEKDNNSNNCNNLNFTTLTNNFLKDFDNREQEDFYDKENSPPIPRESSKYSYIDPELNSYQSPVEVNLEAGISHIVSDDQKVVEIPITVDLKIKENFDLSAISNFSKDYIVIFNTTTLNMDNVCQIFKILHEKMTDNDRVFTNVLNLNSWLTAQDLQQILYSDNFQNFLIIDTEYLNCSGITKLVTYCIDLSFEFHSNIFSLILVNDIDQIPLDVDYLEEIKVVSNKLKDSRVSLIKNFTINCIVLDHCKFEEKTPQNVKSVSFFYDLSMLCLGYFFSPKDSNELYKSVYILSSLLEQTSLLNVRVNIKGNKDPSVFIEVMNYPHMKKQHNNFDVYLGSLMRKEKKFLNLKAVVILNSQNVALNLPLLEINLEFMTLKQRESISNFNSMMRDFSSANLIRNKTPYYQIFIPIITRNKEVFTSNSVQLRSCCAKIADLLRESLEFAKSFCFEESLNKLYQAKNLFEQTLGSQTALIKYFKLFSDLNNSCSINLNMNNVHFLNQTKINTTINTVSNSISNDDSLFDMVKNINSSNISKMFNFCVLILTDINNLIEMIKSRNINLLSDFFTIQQSLMYYRPVHLSDERFLDDVIE